MIRAAYLSLAIGFVLGTAPLAVPLAQAQKVAAPSQQAFVLFEFEVRDPKGFAAFAAKVRDTAKAFKGEFVMREKVTSLFGGSPSNLSVISFTTVDDARKWLASPDLQNLRAERDKAADVRTYLVEKLE